ncbi:PilZ domain-containing protein [Alkalimonas amylolytica]|uniref:Cyclic diguanosine monophosphate-binding protein n=1 Tax=Alkalimonas amylolytica TaxID=152573 RepID=A0A1H4CQG2_ALKAM|nr:PilZ domain-containing protein [Alkalimonas amylolytica]SEA62590.1 PilZ domain-containing protein [Alkalimonas amylolytica]
MNNRRFHRIPFHGPANLKVAGESYATELLDLSLKGALVSKPDDFPAHTQFFELHVPLQDSVLNISMQVRVAHQTDAILGLHCEKIDLDSISHLKRLVQLNLGDDQLLERELSELSHAD